MALSVAGWASQRSVSEAVKASAPTMAWPLSLAVEAAALTVRR
jgi:hypothetical protein